MRRVSSTSRCHLLDSASTDVEALLAAQAVEELEPQLAARRGRRRSRAGTPRPAAPRPVTNVGPHADVRRRRPPAPVAVDRDRRTARVDAVAGADERRVGDEVGGREAERAPALVAVRDRRRAAGTARRAARRRAPTSPPSTARGCGSRRRSRRRASTSSTTRVSKRVLGAQQRRRRPAARWPKRKFSPTLTRSAPSCSTSTSSMKSCAERRREGAVERDDDELARRRARRSARPCVSSDVSSFGAESGRDDRARVRLERQHGVGAAR